MDVFSPNTSAFLNYISQVDGSSNDVAAVKTEPTSLPPSAFFNQSGLQADDNASSSARNTASASPEKEMGDDAERNARRGSSAQHDPAGMHKRKAGHSHTVDQSSDGEDDSEDDVQSGHEDKRAHGSKASAPASGSGRRGRKSVGGEDTPSKGSKDSKAARRKEQNRAAQKAFRERREAKVKTLEDKVAELEQKSQATNVENENLRGLLKRLQEENVALKQSAFTFTMPVGGTPSGGTGTSTPRTSSATYGARPQVKPPTPPHSSSEDPLKSLDDIRPPHLQHRGSSGNSAVQVDTPESMASISSRSNSRSGSEQPKQPPMFDPAETFNAFALGVRPEWERQNQLNRQTSGASATANASGAQPGSSGSNSNFADAMSLLSSSGSGLSPLSSSGSNNKSDIEALWASFYPNGAQAVQAQAGPSGAQRSEQPAQPNAQQSLPFAMQGSQSSPFNLFLSSGTQQSSTTGLTPFINPANNTNPMDRMAFRDSGASGSTQPAAAAANASGQTSAVPVASPPSFDWSAWNDDGVDSFLQSLSGSNGNVDQNDAAADDDFSEQIQALINANASNISSGAFGLGTQTFSPTNYLNMSPSPLGAGSTSSGLSPASNNMSAGSASVSNYASPDSMASSHASTAATSHREGSVGEAEAMGSAAAAMLPANKQASNIVYVVGPDGKVIKPSDLWIKMGMQHVSTVDHLVIDDLCDQMKAKATCKDGASYLNYDDAEKMFKYSGKYPDGTTAAKAPGS